MKTLRFSSRFLLKWVVPGFALAFVFLFAAEYGQEHLLMDRNPAPGQMVDIGGYRLHLNCTGQGPTTVILEAGLGDSSLIWHDVQQSISEFTTACSYDRAGFGWSDRGPLPRDPFSETTELQLLTKRAHIAGPEILVGHSMGGDLVRLYASRFPEQIAGIVLVEPSNEDKWKRIPGLVTEWDGYRRECRWDSWKARIGWLRFEHQPLEDYPNSIRPLAESLNYFPKAAAANCEEINSIIGVGPSQVAQARTLGRTPLIVITAGRNIFTDDTSLPAREAAGNVWKEMQKETAALSADGEQVFAQSSGHFVQHDQPDLVVNQVHQLMLSTSSSARKQ